MVGSGMNVVRIESLGVGCDNGNGPSGSINIGETSLQAELPSAF